MRNQFALRTSRLISYLESLRSVGSQFERVLEPEKAMDQPRVVRLALKKVNVPAVFNHPAATFRIAPRLLERAEFRRLIRCYVPRIYGQLQVHRVECRPVGAYHR